ncbi:glycosyltransferase [Neptuniibacter sp. QD57_21]|uniref:glycosyltransferase n=1 Tax=Neptuniibacter sp. QD57_21 TaxID=3398213 RepID=UPI0039F47CDF
MRSNELLIIQPLLAGYRVSFFNDLSQFFDKVTIMADIKEQKDFGASLKKISADILHAPILGERTKLYYQQGIVKKIFKCRPKSIFIAADFRAISFWAVLVSSKVLRIPVFTHGQGLYDKPNPKLLYKIIFKAAVILSSRYICYTDFSKRTAEAIGVQSNKLAVMNNTIVNSSPITPETKNVKTKRLIYIGRLREGSNLELLLEAMKILKKRSVFCSLDIIGDGEKIKEYKSYVRKAEIDVVFHGAIFDDEVISEISKSAVAGVYPGDAGLSIVHYMSLSLVPIAHNDITKHMGPEPSYIKNMINGILFERNNVISLAESIDYVISNPSSAKEIFENSYITYQNLTSISMAEILMSSMNEFLKDQS